MMLRSHSRRIYEAELKDEAAAFEAFASDLAPALGQLRRLVASPSWLMTWAVETVQSFGPDVTSASYGETFFKSWKAVIDHPEMVKVVEKSPAVVIMGSSLGYTCLFFAAVGIPCPGYDLLKQSMVQTAQEYVCSAPLQVPVEFKVGDASEAPLISRFQTPNMPSILWLNDEVWPAELRVAVKERAATELTVGSMVVSYGPQETTALRPEAALRVSTSWCRQEQIWLLRYLDDREVQGAMKRIHGFVWLSLAPGDRCPAGRLQADGDTLICMRARQSGRC
eukprot:g27462.t1